MSPKTANEERGPLFKLAERWNRGKRWGRWKRWGGWLRGAAITVLGVAKVLVPVVVFLFGIYLVFVSAHPAQVEGSFTRVGGPTRIETAADAARFWLIAPKRVVTASVRADPAVVIYAAKCAMDNDAPLLFTPRKGQHNTVVHDLLGQWYPKKSAPRPITPITSTTSYCPVAHPRLAPIRLPTLRENADVLPLNLPVTRQASLQPFVVFASSKAPAVPRRSGSARPTEERDLPDVAVGLALAAHMARDHPNLGGVSLVVVPEYLEADTALENRLRSQHGEVLGGIVLGGEDRISDDTRTLLREILHRPDRAGILAAIKDDLGDTEGFIAAILALLLGTAASAAVVGAAQRSLFTENHKPDSKGEPPVTDEPPASSSQLSGKPTPPPPRTVGHNPFEVSDYEQPRVTLYVDGGREVTGVYQGEETLGSVSFVKLSSVQIAGLDPGRLVTVEATLIPVSKIELATTEAPPEKPTAS